MLRLSYQTGLPGIAPRKIYKTGQTRGAEADEIYQNRVSRSSTVLIPLSFWLDSLAQFPNGGFEKGHIFIAKPADYDARYEELQDHQIILGNNLLVYYRTRAEWTAFHPSRYGWNYATSRQPPLGGQYIARVPSTTSEGTQQIFEGFTGSSSGGTGAGIRFYEYASNETLKACRYQLAYLAWRTAGMREAAAVECGRERAESGYRHVTSFCEQNGLADTARLVQARIMHDDTTICPLCLRPVTADELLSRVQQVEGREVPDLTVTSANLFHIDELRPGVYNHIPYNLGWGHHHCNQVARDFGIGPTLEWLEDILTNNGYTVSRP